MDGLVSGRLVYFVADAATADSIRQQRADSGRYGNVVREGEIIPAVVVKVWDATAGYVNLKLLLDGPDAYWATSVFYSAEQPPRSWHWMYDGQATRGTKV